MLIKYQYHSKLLDTTDSVNI